jgi:hypothetical protein
MSGPPACCHERERPFPVGVLGHNIIYTYIAPFLRDRGSGMFAF